MGWGVPLSLLTFRGFQITTVCVNAIKVFRALIASKANARCYGDGSDRDWGRGVGDGGHMPKSDLTPPCPHQGKFAPAAILKSMPILKN